MSIRKLSYIAVLALVTAACGEGTQPSDADATAPEPTTSTTIDPRSEQVPQQVIEKATVDLATLLKVDEAEIEVISAEAVTWSDGSLGCPEPGKVYTQALVEGHRIVLAHHERVYDYHAGGDLDPFLCPNPDSEDGGYDFVPPPGDDTR